MLDAVIRRAMGLLGAARSEGRGPEPRHVSSVPAEIRFFAEKASAPGQGPALRHLTERRAGREGV